MLKFFFIKKHQKNVFEYIKSVFNPFETTEESRKRYALPEDSWSWNDHSARRTRIQYSRKSGSDTPSEESDNSSETKDNSVQSEGDHIKFQKKNTEPDVLYSDRDSFNPALVSAAMRRYLVEKTPVNPLNYATNLTFVQQLRYYILIKNLIETDVYKAALMDRRLFSKIISNKDYKPSKDTVLALIFALKLDINEAADLLERAGYTLSHSIKRDIIIEYFIKEKIYNLNNVNAFLYNMDEKIIGRSV